MDKPKEPGKPISPEIAILTEKLAKDPKSRLFVPLAEEYLKSEMLDEAVMVLTDGLKIHPTFHVARAMLAKVFLEKGQVAEAKVEFERVIQASPDNLLAQRKLAGIYRDEGQIDKARSACRAVLQLNPKDAEMTSIMQELDRIEQAAQQKLKERATVSTELPSGGIQVEQTGHAQPEPAKVPVVAEAEPAPQETVVPQPSVAVEAAPVGEPAPEAATKAPPPTEEINTEKLADLYIKQGHYEKGIAIYRRLLAKDPSNQSLFKKLDETVELVRMLSEGPQIQKGPQPAPEKSTPAASTEVPVAQTPPAADRERQRMLKIQRLQAWLDNIKKGQGG